MAATLPPDVPGVDLKMIGKSWHTLAWGYNQLGELGDGTQAGRLSPVGVRGMGSGIQAAAAGLDHNLAVRTDGTLWAWGDNTNGQLGDGTLTNRIVPVPVPALSRVWRVAAGDRHSLALRADGTVWAWGVNSNGQLGDGSTIDHRTPAQVLGLSGVRSLASGYYHGLALRADGSVWAWGRNSNGQLGDGSTQDRSSPFPVPGLANVRAVAAGGFHSLALDANGAVWAWGRNASGQVGDGSTTDLRSPVQITGLAVVQELAAGEAHSLAVDTGGTSWAWGDNSYGQLGDGTRVSRTLPVPLGGLGGNLVLAGGAGHSLAVRSDGSVWAWGNNLYGQLGDGTQTEQLLPSPVDVGPRSWAGCGIAHSLAVTLSPSVAIRGTGLDDGSLAGSSGNRDGVLNPGERASVGIVLRNVGIFPLSGVSATLSLNTPDAQVTIPQPTEIYGGILAGGEAPGTNRYLVEVAANTPTPHAIALLLTIQDNQGHTWVRDLSLTAYASGRISGTLTLDGQPLAGAWVNLSGAAAATQQTAADGTYAFVPLLDGNYTVSTSPPGYLPPHPVQVSVPPDPPNVDFTFATATVSGTVTRNGFPLAGAKIAFSGAFSGSVFSAADGTYSIVRVFGQAATMNLKASFRGYPDSGTVQVSLPPSQAGVDFAFSGSATPNADFDGDRKADILFRQPSSGGVYLWLMR